MVAAGLLATADRRKGRPWVWLKKPPDLLPESLRIANFAGGKATIRSQGGAAAMQVQHHCQEKAMQVVYEDNHLIIIYKESGEIVQGDKTGDRPLSELVKDYLKEKYNKPGEAFLGVVHRLDRPVSGLVVFAKTSKSLTRLNKMFANGEVHKTYWAVVEKKGQGGEVSAHPSSCTEATAPADTWHTLTHWLVRNEKQNKSYAYEREKPQAKKAVLKYRVIGQGDRYTLLEVNLMTGRHHQIRCQLSAVGRPIKGDLKYGARRSNPDGSISLLSHKVEFVHPVSKTLISIVSPLPDDTLWRALAPREE